MIVRSAVAASGLRSPSRVAAAGAGTVSTTASASIAGPDAGWTVHRPSWRSSAATGVAVRISPPARRDRGAEPLDEDAHAAARSEERAGRRLTGGARAGGAGLRAQAEQQAAVLGEGVGDLRGHRPQAQVVGVAGVDAADQRVDQAVEHLVAEAGPDGQAEGVALVAGRVPAGQQGLDRGPGLAPPRQQAGSGPGRQARPVRRARGPGAAGGAARRDQTTRAGSPAPPGRPRGRGRGPARPPPGPGPGTRRRRSRRSGSPANGVVWTLPPRRSSASSTDHARLRLGGAAARRPRPGR